MATAPMATTIVFVILFLSLMVGSSRALHNITDILAHFPDYSIYNSYLSQTKVADEINSRETVTCLVLSNPAMSTLAAKRPLSAVKNALRLLTLLDYYDSAKLHSISHGTVQTTTLLQTTGNFRGSLGFVNITDLKGGKVGFGSTSPGSKLDSTYTKSVKQLPYSISVLEISAPIVFPGLLDVPNESTTNLTSLLEKAGCKMFASLILSSGVLKIFQDAMGRGLTVFAPNDEAFKADGVPDLHSLSQAELVTLLEYHALPEYAPKATLKVTKHPLSTLATSATHKYDITVITSGDEVTLRTGVDTSRVASTVVDDPPLCILTVDNVLLPPIELHGKGRLPALGPAPAAAPTPSPTVLAPVPAPAEAPAPERASPVVPPSQSSEVSPAGAPDGTAADVDDNQEGAAMRVGPRLVAVVGGIVASVLAMVTSFS